MVHLAHNGALLSYEVPSMKVLDISLLVTLLN